MFTTAQVSLLIFGFCIVLFISEKLPMASAAILGCILMVVFQVASFQTVFGQFASSSVILVISMMIVGRTMFETGAAHIIGSCIMRLSGGDEKKILIVSVVLCAAVSAFMSNVATLAIFISILSNLFDGSTGVEKRNLILPVAMASVVGGVCTMIGSAPQITTQGILEETLGQGFGFFAYAKVGVILVAALVVYVAVIGYPMGRRIWGGRKDEEDMSAVQCHASDMNAAVDEKRLIIAGTIFLVMGILFFLEPVPIAIVGAGAAMACVISGCISQKKAIESVDWSCVGKLAGCLGIMQAVNKSGGGDLIGKAFFSLIGDSVHPYVLFAAMVLMVIFLSEFLTNSTAVLIVLPMAISICPELNLNIYTFAMGITLGSSVALATPLSCTPLTMAAGYGYRFSDFVRYSLPFDILAGLLIILIVPIFYPL